MLSQLVPSDRGPAPPSNPSTSTFILPRDIVALLPLGFPWPPHADPDYLPTVTSSSYLRRKTAPDVDVASRSVGALHSSSASAARSVNQATARQTDILVDAHASGTVLCGRGAIRLVPRIALDPRSRTSPSETQVPTPLQGRISPSVAKTWKFEAESSTLRSAAIVLWAHPQVPSVTAPHHGIPTAGCCWVGASLNYKFRMPNPTSTCPYRIHRRGTMRQCHPPRRGQISIRRRGARKRRRRARNPLLREGDMLVYPAHQVRAFPSLVLACPSFPVYISLPFHSTFSFLRLLSRCPSPTFHSSPFSLHAPCYSLLSLFSLTIVLPSPFSRLSPFFHSLSFPPPLAALPRFLITDSFPQARVHADSTVPCTRCWSKYVRPYLHTPPPCSSSSAPSFSASSGFSLQPAPMHPRTAPPSPQGDRGAQPHLYALPAAGYPATITGLRARVKTRASHAVLDPAPNRGSSVVFPFLLRHLRSPNLSARRPRLHSQTRFPRPHPLVGVVRMRVDISKSCAPFRLGASRSTFDADSSTLSFTYSCLPPLSSGARCHTQARMSERAVHHPFVSCLEQDLPPALSSSTPSSTRLLRLVVHARALWCRPRPCHQATTSYTLDPRCGLLASCARARYWQGGREGGTAGQARLRASDPRLSESSSPSRASLAVGGRGLSSRSTPGRREQGRTYEHTALGRLISDCPSSTYTRHPHSLVDAVPPPVLVALLARTSPVADVIADTLPRTSEEGMWLRCQLPSPLHLGRRLAPTPRLSASHHPTLTRIRLQNPLARALLRLAPPLFVVLPVRCPSLATPLRDVVAVVFVCPKGVYVSGVLSCWDVTGRGALDTRKVGGTRTCKSLRCRRDSLLRLSSFLSSCALSLRAHRHHDPPPASRVRAPRATLALPLRTPTSVLRIQLAPSLTCFHRRCVIQGARASGTERCAALVPASTASILHCSRYPTRGKASTDGVRKGGRLWKPEGILPRYTFPVVSAVCSRASCRRLILAPSKAL
ncbi:hypothetical protein B0H17DRAFT_1205730 [Mycena rosella]|uniref:Uncharacterized protein n=1 Tax=Mycena rosella TaxID=1033263 RepID=A0AAD7GEJ0_MYCRO|nr:hypothetical protein B0H17DRAFT_1205730 [Mycena rosella]